MLQKEHIMCEMKHEPGKSNSFANMFNFLGIYLWVS